MEDGTGATDRPPWLASGWCYVPSPRGRRSSCLLTFPYATPCSTSSESRRPSPGRRRMTRLDEGAQPTTARRLPQFSQRCRLDLPNPLTRQRELLSELGQRRLGPISKAESHPDDFSLFRAQCLEHRLGLSPQVIGNGRLGRIDGLPVFDEVTKLALLAVTDGRIGGRPPSVRSCGPFGQPRSGDRRVQQAP